MLQRRLSNVAVASQPANLPQECIKQSIAVQASHITRVYSGRTVINSLDLTIHAGEFIALLGESGSGKTTLLRIFAGLDSPDYGEIWVPRERTVVFQEPRLINSSRVWRNVCVGLSGTASSRERAIAALAEVGLKQRADAWPATLSGGEAQRVALARALVRKPGLLLLDEPFAALDALTRLKMQGLVSELCQTYGPATLLVTHDVDEAIRLADRILVLRDGQIAFDYKIRWPTSRRHSSEAEFRALRALLLEELGLRIGMTV